MPDQPTPTPETRQQSPSDRVRHALARPGRGQLIAGLLLAVLGFAAVAQVQSTEKDDNYAGMRQSDLVQLINSLSLATQRAEKNVAQLQQTRDSLRTDTDSRSTALQRARDQANVLGILAGTLPATGPGVVVTITDDSGVVGTNEMLDAMMELRDAGAEAIEINDSVRVVAQTAFRDGLNGGVTVDDTQLSPPYVITAIGDPDVLSTALSISGGFIADVERVGGAVTVEKSDDVVIASTRKPTKPDYAEPAPTG